MIVDLATTPVFDTYWSFAYERQEIFHRRLTDEDGPWTDDPILAGNKFTNAYRAADRVSQFLIKEVIYRGSFSVEDTVFRILLFKIFNRIETWQWLEGIVDEVRASKFDFRRIGNSMSAVMRKGQRLYSAAYIMPSGRSSFGHREKHRNHLCLLEQMMAEGLPLRLAKARTMNSGYEELLRFPTIGPFLAYQFITDINYSEVTDFSEMDFVVPGPGARSGIAKCVEFTRGVTGEEVIRHMAELQAEEFEKRGLKFRSLWGRPLQLVDCQNLFCEVDKYARVAHPECNLPGLRTRIKQRFTPTRREVNYWFPPKWGINDRIALTKTSEQARRGAAVASVN